jgi:hypothetical protein
MNEKIVPGFDKGTAFSGGDEVVCDRLIVDLLADIKISRLNELLGIGF